MKPVIDFTKTHSNVFQFRLKYASNGVTPSDEIRRAETALMNDENIKILWDFGDGRFSTERSPIHTYATPGDFLVKAYLDYEQSPSTIHVVDPVNSDPGPPELPESTRSLEPVNSDPGEPDLPGGSRSLEPVNSDPGEPDLPGGSRSLEPVNSDPGEPDLPGGSRSLEPVNSDPGEPDLPGGSRSLEPVNSDPGEPDLPGGSRSLEPVNSDPGEPDLPRGSRSLEPVNSDPGPPELPEETSIKVIQGDDWFNGPSPIEVIPQEAISVVFPFIPTETSTQIRKIFVSISLKDSVKNGEHLILRFNSIQKRKNELMISRIVSMDGEALWKPVEISGLDSTYRDEVLIKSSGDKQYLIEFWNKKSEVSPSSFSVAVIAKLSGSNSTNIKAAIVHSIETQIP